MADYVLDPDRRIFFRWLGTNYLRAQLSTTFPRTDDEDSLFSRLRDATDSFRRLRANYDGADKYSVTYACHKIAPITSDQAVFQDYAQAVVCKALIVNSDEDLRWFVRLKKIDIRDENMRPGINFWLVNTLCYLG